MAGVTLVKANIGHPWAKENTPLQKNIYVLYEILVLFVAGQGCIKFARCTRGAQRFFHDARTMHSAVNDAQLNIKNILFLFFSFYRKSVHREIARKKGVHRVCIVKKVLFTQCASCVFSFAG